MVENIRPNPFQPRLEIDEAELVPLIEEMRNTGFHGSLEARRSDLSDPHSPLQLVFGERRWKAATAAGLRTIPIRIVDYDDREMARQALIENLQRVNLTLYEEALAVGQLMKSGLGYDRIAKAVGKSKGWVVNRAQILKLEGEQLEFLKENDAAATFLTTIQWLDPDLREQMFDRFKNNEVGVEDARALVRAQREGLRRLESTTTDDGGAIRIVSLETQRLAIKRARDERAALEVATAEPDEVVLEKPDPLWERVREDALREGARSLTRDNAALTSINQPPLRENWQGNPDGQAAGLTVQPVTTTWAELDAETGTPSAARGEAMAATIPLKTMVLDETTTWKSDHARQTEQLRNAGDGQARQALEADILARKILDDNLLFVRTLREVIRNMRVNVERCHPEHMTVEELGEIRSIRSDVTDILAIF